MPVMEVPSMPPLGCTDMMTQTGMVHFHDATGIITILVEGNVNGPPRPKAVGIGLYDGGDGVIVQMTPELARHIAMGLLRIADTIAPELAN
jgi:hypothetical protein